MELKELYEAKELTEAKADRKRAGTAMAVVAAAGLLGCILLCCLATRQNQHVTFPATVGVSVLSGWIVIFLSHSRYEDARARVRHVELMLDGPRERFTGSFRKLDGVYRVKRGVSVRKVSQQEDFHETLLTVYEAKACRMPDAFDGTVETVYDCIVAFREADR